MSSDIDNIKNEIQKRIDEIESQIASIKQRESSLPKMIETEKSKLADSEQLYAEDTRQAEQNRQRIFSEIEEYNHQKDVLISRIKRLEAEMSNLGLFQGKKKKELAEQIAPIKTNLNVIVTNMTAKASNLENIGGSTNAVENTKQNIVALEKELADIPAKIKTLNDNSMKLKSDRDGYEWKPEKIDVGFYESEFVFLVEDVFGVTGLGIVAVGNAVDHITAVGHITAGSISVNDRVEIIHADGTKVSTVVTQIDSYRKFLDTATVCDDIIVLHIPGVAREQVNRGDTIVI